MTQTATTDPGAWTLPNLLTMLRTVAAPAAALSYALLDRPLADIVAFWLFAGASLTDFLDGWLARRLNQVSALGRMLDPVADKAMVIISLAAILAVNGTSWLYVLPTAAILLRETLVSGLREALAGRTVIHVTQLAKWKTTVQMFAIGALFLAGYAEGKHELAFYNLPPDLYEAMLSGAAPDTMGVGFWSWAAPMLEAGGLALLWLAAGLTVVTGVDYLKKGVAALQRG